MHCSNPPAGRSRRPDGSSVYHHAMNRRKFVLGTLAGAGALVVGWSVLPARQRLVPGTPLPLSGTQHALNGWVKIDEAGIVTIVMSHAEMGQGTHTGVAMLLAEELDADWATVRLESSTLDGIYNNLGVLDKGPPLVGEPGLVERLTAHFGSKVMREFGMMMTGGSSSLKDLWWPMRRAGAAARAMLVQAAAAAWQVPAAEIVVVAGRLSHRSGRSAGFGEFVKAAAELPIDRDPPLKDPASFRLIGTPVSRLDAPAKSTGREQFALDVRLPGMLRATVVMAPTPGGSLRSIDDSLARAVPGVRGVLRVAAHGGSPAGVAVVADNTWQALQGARALRLEWVGGPERVTDSRELPATYRAAAAGESRVALERGDAVAAIAAAARRIEADYWAPYLAHATLEPMNCTVLVGSDRAEVWAPTQVPKFARDAVAKVLDFEGDSIQLHRPTLGGGFGRRLETDYVAQAAEIAKAFPDRPVQTVWSREEDLRHDFYRPAFLARCRAGLDAAGRLTGLDVVSVGQSVTPLYLNRHLGLPKSDGDAAATEGTADQAYEVPAARVSHVPMPSPVPVGFWRSVGHSHQAFFHESFMDEIAHAAGRDPADFRLDLLANRPRQRRVLERLVAFSGWREPLAAPAPGVRTGRGLALHQSFGSVVGQVAEVAVDADGHCRVQRVHCVVECGYPVNPGLIRQQVEGSVQFGLCAALHGEITFADGQVTQSNFHDHPLLRLSESPEVLVEILPAGETPQGIGEPGVPPVAPAVANAIFAATRQRLRSLPLRLDK